jgi:hypothetical protein
MLHEGAEIKRTNLTEQFNYEDYRSEYEGNFVPLLIFRDKQVRVVTADDPFNPQPGWTLVSLVSPNKLSQNILLRSAADETNKDNLLEEMISLTQKTPRRSQ